VENSLAMSSIGLRSVTVGPPMRVRVIESVEVPGSQTIGRYSPTA
jgi:hypothetical protein